MDSLMNLSDELDSDPNFKSLICDPEDVINYALPAHSSISLLTQNIRSINCNLPGFETLLSRIKINIDIIILTECWLSLTPVIPQLESYLSYSTKNNFNQNDGVVLYVKDYLEHTVEEAIFSDANGLIIKLGKDTAILAIYRSPSTSNITPFLMTLDEHLKNVSLQKLNLDGRHQYLD